MILKIVLFRNALIAGLCVVLADKLAAQTLSGPLTVNCSNATIIVSWPADFDWIQEDNTFATYDLVASTDLGPTAVWLDWSYQTVIGYDAFKRVTILPPAPQMFFRLIRRTHRAISCTTNADCGNYCSGACVNGRSQAYCATGIAPNGQPYPCSQ